MLNIGWPASVHAEQMWSNTMIAWNPEHFFSPGKYILGDSAFAIRHTLCQYSKIWVVGCSYKMSSQDSIYYILELV